MRMLLAGFAMGLVAGALGYHLVSRHRAVREEGLRAVEESAWLDAGVRPLEEVGDGTLLREMAQLLADSAELRLELERAKQASPGARAVGLARGRAGPARSPGEAESVPRPSDTPPPCLLQAGDTGEVLVEELELQGTGGARALVGTASAWRVEPGPAVRLFGGALRWDLALEVPAERAPALRVPDPKAGWAAGLWGGVGSRGWLLGPAVGLPPVRVGPLELEVLAGLGGGADGAWAVQSAGLLRWE